MRPRWAATTFTATVLRPHRPRRRASLGISILPNYFLKKGKSLMQGYRVDVKQVPAPSMALSSAKSRDLSIPPSLDLHTPVGPELA
eukprot:COSAG01_NODE_489_length_16370_cov_7.973818_8_plen_86_part_00